MNDLNGLNDLNTLNDSITSKSMNDSITPITPITPISMNDSNGLKCTGGYMNILSFRDFEGERGLHLNRMNDFNGDK